MLNNEMATPNPLKVYKFERGHNTHSKGGTGEIPLLPYKVGKRSGTIVTTDVSWELFFTSNLF